MGTAAEKAEAAQQQKQPFTAKLFAATNLMFTDSRMMLLAPVNITFGFIAAWLNSYITGTIIPQGIGDDKVGYLVAIIPAIATALSMPIGKLAAMLLGSASFLAVVLCFLPLDTPQAVATM